MCVIRKGEIDKLLIELRYGRDMEDLCTAIKSALSESDRQGNMRPNIVNAGFLAQELIDRREWLLIPGILTEICANTLIREDENPYIVDPELLKKKVDTINNEIGRGGLAAFFLSLDLPKSIGLSSISISDLSRFMTDSVIRLTQFQARMNLCTSDIK